VDMRKRKELGSLARWDEGKIPRRFFLLEGQEGKGKTPVFPSTHVLGSGTRQGPGAGDLTDGGFTFGLLFCICRLEILLIPLP
jgi:hypothetical protein